MLCTLITSFLRVTHTHITHMSDEICDARSACAVWSLSPMRVITFSRMEAFYSSHALAAATGNCLKAWKEASFNMRFTLPEAHSAIASLYKKMS